MLTEMVQLPLVGMVEPARETEFEAATAVAVPPHELESPLGVAMTKPEGMVSVKATPVRACRLAGGLVSVKVSEAAPFGAMPAGLKDLAIEGGASTVRLAEAVPPVPPCVEVMPLVVFV
jgi:hypothetical protein